MPANFIPITLGLLVAWFLGYEMGKGAMVRTLKKMIKDMTDELTKATNKLKEHKEDA